MEEVLAVGGPATTILGIVLFTEVIKKGLNLKAGQPVLVATFLGMAFRFLTGIIEADAAGDGITLTLSLQLLLDGAAYGLGVAMAYEQWQKQQQKKEGGA